MPLAKGFSQVFENRWAALAFLALAAAAPAALELGLEVGLAFSSAWAVTAASLWMLCKLPLTLWAAVQLAASHPGAEPLPLKKGQALGWAPTEAPGHGHSATDTPARGPVTLASSGH